MVCEWFRRVSFEYTFGAGIVCHSIGSVGPKAVSLSGSRENVIFLYMDGGPSHVDTFDYKPQLEKV